jgi:hypothetical protein
MVTWHCYHDTSGTQLDKRVIVTVGIVASVEKWIRFDRAWKKTLSDFNVTEFHTKDFAHFKKEYASWRHQERKRREFLGRLLHALKQGINKVFISSVLLDDYKEVNALYLLDEQFGGAYSIAQAASIGRVTAWLIKKKPANDRVQHFIEEGDTGQHEFMKRMDEIAFEAKSLPKLDPTTGASRLAFQAADFIAYEHRRVYNEYRERGQLQNVRAPILLMRNTLPFEARVLEKTELIRLCTDTETRKRGF